jgi:tetratricopeptide (TPR) repeat protein
MIARWIIACVLGLTPGVSSALYCGEITNSFGPFDYTDPAHRGPDLQIVETRHFTPEVEGLIKGASSYIGADLDYTLRAFPNHHRALQSMMLLSQREKKAKPGGAGYTVECYFDRALRFKPDDPTVLMLHGMFLNTQGKLDDAITEVEKANQLSPNDANINYNLGLLYFDKKHFAKSREHAKIAYDLGFPLPGLKNKLTKAGQWEGN